MIQTNSYRVTNTYNKYNFTRKSTAYDSNGKLYLPNDARYKTINGRTGIMVEEGTNPVPSNCFFTNGVDDWSLPVNGGGVASKSSVVGGNFGGKIARITITNPADQPFHIQIFKSIGNLTNGQKVSVQGRIKASINCSVSPYCVDSTAWTNYGGTAVNLTPEWQTFNFIATVTKDGPARIHIDMGTVPVGTIIDIDYFLAEVGKNYSTNPQNGLRQSEALTFPTNGLIASQGTIEFQYYEDGSANYQIARVLLNIANATKTQPNISIYRNPNRTFTFRMRSDTGVVQDIVTLSILTVGWHLVRLTYNSISIKAYIDDYITPVGVYNNPTLPVNFDTIGYLGIDINKAQPANTYISELRLSNIVRSDTINSTKPLPTDSNTILNLNFNNPNKQFASKNIKI